ncbi:MAG: hypothetical protein H6725_01435 [Sandaracinaceae bacterium]|nr:hypothetical protein [Sandaracinaceae bacterium]
MELSAPDLANSVTSFATLGAGVITLLLCWLGRPQPRRWVVAYALIVVTGIPTLGWHATLAPSWRWADTGSNLLLAFGIQVAVLFDYFDAPLRRRVLVASATLNALGIAWMGVETALGRVPFPLRFGDHGGFNVGELVLVADALIVTALLFSARPRIPERARGLLTAILVTFLLGVALASADGRKVDLRVISHHALWHIVSAFGFVLFWAFNDLRLHEGASEPR